MRYTPSKKHLAICPDCQGSPPDLASSKKMRELDAWIHAQVSSNPVVPFILQEVAAQNSMSLESAWVTEASAQVATRIAQSRARRLANNHAIPEFTSREYERAVKRHALAVLSKVLVDYSLVADDVSALRNVPLLRRAVEQRYGRFSLAGAEVTYLSAITLVQHQDAVARAFNDARDEYLTWNKHKEVSPLVGSEILRVLSVAATNPIDDAPTTARVLARINAPSTRWVTLSNDAPPINRSGLEDFGDTVVFGKSTLARLPRLISTDHARRVIGARVLDRRRFDEVLLVVPKLRANPKGAATARKENAYLMRRVEHALVHEFEMNPTRCRYHVLRQAVAYLLNDASH